jgi:uncharacterized damage-inducible protein DinB
MSNVPPWFERKFDFSFPLELYPNVLVRLLGAPARLEELVSGISRDVRIVKPEGKWSVQEHAGHLADLEPLWMARVNDFLSGGETLTIADLTNRRTHDANHNGHELQQILNTFRAERSQLLERLKDLRSAEFARTLIHPRLQQPMRLVDHLYFVAEHDDHHLAMIHEMSRAS